MCIRDRVCHPRSAGQGLDFSFVDAAIYITLPASYVEYVQSSYRLSAYDGSDEKTIYILTDPIAVRNYALRFKETEINRLYEKGEL